VHDEATTHGDARNPNHLPRIVNTFCVAAPPTGEIAQFGQHPVLPEKTASVAPRKGLGEADDLARIVDRMGLL